MPSTFLSFSGFLKYGAIIYQRARSQPLSGRGKRSCRADAPPPACCAAGRRTSRAFSERLIPTKLQKLAEHGAESAFSEDLSLVSYPSLASQLHRLSTGTHYSTDRDVRSIRADRIENS